MIGLVHVGWLQKLVDDAGGILFRIAEEWGRGARGSRWAVQYNAQAWGYEGCMLCLRVHNHKAAIELQEFHAVCCLVCCLKIGALAVEVCVHEVVHGASVFISDLGVVVEVQDMHVLHPWGTAIT